MMTINDWIAELTERRRLVEQKIKESTRALQAELEAVDVALADLQRLAAFDAVGAVGGATTSTAPTRPSVTTEKLPLWKWASLALSEIGHPATIPELGREIHKRGGASFEGNARRETLRGSVRTKDDVFESVGDGLYALREWPSERKRGKAVTVSQIKP